jgi:hypothetical protein
VGLAGDGLRGGVLLVAVGPRHVSAKVLPALGLERLREEVPKLLVVDQGGRALVLDDPGELRRRERRVQVQRLGSELRAGERGIDEAAVVAAHDRDPVALADAIAGQPTRQGVRALVELGEGERPGLVDERGGIPPRVRADRGAGCWRGAPAQELPQRMRRLVRPLELDHPGLVEGLRVERDVDELPQGPRRDPLHDGVPGDALREIDEPAPNGHAQNLIRGDETCHEIMYRSAPRRGTRCPLRDRSTPSPRWWSP